MLLITGATGHSGKWFIRNLEAEHYKGKIKCVVRSLDKTDFLKKTNLDLEFVVGDLEDPKLLEKAMEGVETVVHIAGILFSKGIVEAGRKNNVQWFILVHTTGRFSKFRSASENYIQIEDKLIEEHSNITILRPTMIYGSSMDRNMWKLIKFIKRFKFFPLFGRGTNLMQPVHAKDLGKAYFDVMMNKEKTLNQQYDLSGKEAISYKEILKIVSKKLEKKTVFVYIPLWISLAGAYIYNLIWRGKAIISVEQVMRLMEDKAFCHDKAKRDFGYGPTSFQEGIDDEIQELLNTSSLS